MKVDTAMEGGSQILAYLYERFQVQVSANLNPDKIYQTMKFAALKEGSTACPKAVKIDFMIFSKKFGTFCP